MSHFPSNGLQSILMDCAGNQTIHGELCTVAVSGPVAGRDILLLALDILFL